MDVPAHVLTHPILVQPISGEYADPEEDCMLVGEYKDATHLFQSVLIEEVRKSIEPVPKGTVIPNPNSVVMMKAEDFEKLRKRIRSSEEAHAKCERCGGSAIACMKKRLLALESQNAALKANLTTANQKMLNNHDEWKRHAAALTRRWNQERDQLNIRIRDLDAELYAANTKHAKLLKTRDTRVQKLNAELNALKESSMQKE